MKLDPYSIDITLPPRLHFPEQENVPIPLSSVGTNPLALKYTLSPVLTVGVDEPTDKVFQVVPLRLYSILFCENDTVIGSSAIMV